jgi:cysteinyl-tRNA synthetase
LSEVIRRHTGERIRFFLLRTHYRSTIVYDEEGLQEAGASLEGFYRFFNRFNEITSKIETSVYPGQLFYELPAATTREAGQFDPGNDSLLIGVHAAREKFLAAMDDDFNTGSAISVLFDLLRTLNRHIDQHEMGPDADPGDQNVQSLVKATSVLRELSGVLGLFIKPTVSAGGGDDGDAELLDGVVQLLIDLRKEARARKDYATGDAIRDRLAELGVALLDKKEGTTWERGS